MADNITALANTGTGTDVFATDDIGGVNYPRTKIGFGVDGSYTDVSHSHHLPVVTQTELAEAIQAMRMAVQALTRSGLGQSMPDTAQRLRVVVDAITAGLTLATITTVGTVTTVSTVSTMTNQTQIGGLPATEQIPSLMRLGADSMRRNISVT
jgi:hypothetical protein